MFSRTSRSLLSESTRISQNSYRIPAHASIQRHQLRMASQTAKFRLNTGAHIPAIGFGSCRMPMLMLKNLQSPLLLNQDTAISTQRASTARRPLLEKPSRILVFHAIRYSSPPSSGTPDDVPKALDASLKDLEVDYLNLYLMHLLIWQVIELKLVYCLWWLRFHGTSTARSKLERFLLTSLIT